MHIDDLERRAKIEAKQKAHIYSLPAQEKTTLNEAVKLSRYATAQEWRFVYNMAAVYGCIPLETDGDNLILFLTDLYHYGVIMGIRQERARRRKGA